MPLFNFVCKDQYNIHKGEFYIFEELVISTNVEILCPICRSEVERIFSPTSNIISSEKSHTNKRYDTTSSIRDHIKDLKEKKKNYTTEELYNPTGKTPI